MNEENSPEHEITTALSKGYGSRVARFVLACLGSVPAVGGAFAGAGGAWSEAEQAHYNKVFATWLKLQEDEVKEIGLAFPRQLILFSGQHVKRVCTFCSTKGPLCNGRAEAA